jgi:hypothetical protein
MEDQTIRASSLPTRKARVTNEEVGDVGDEGTGRTGQSKVCRASERKLSDFFTNGSIRNYTDADLHKIAELLRLSQRGHGVPCPEYILF